MFSPEQLPPWARLIVGLCWLVGILNYLDRVVITTMRDPCAIPYFIRPQPASGH